ncbi:MAG TPA: glycosyltransferase [Planctomycetota bacterium]|nr:glycosyltransferase [Planctomycetota bacterium]
MRVLLVSPAPLESASGNAVSVARLAEGMRARGHAVEILVPPAEGGAAILAEALRRFAPDLVHLYHAWRTGRLARGIPAGIPYVLGIGGTDVNRDLEDPGHAREVEEALRRAAAVLAPTSDSRERILRHVPGAAVRVVPKGVSLPGGEFPFRESIGIPPDDPLLFLPAAVRRVKGNLFAARALARLRAGAPRVRGLFAGPSLEPDYAAEFRSALGPRDLHLEAIPRERMASAYRAGDIVLNCSTQEGLSNALLEAMGLGRAVLVSDIPANRALVEEGETGLVYSDEDGFVGCAERLLGDERLRERLGRAAAAFVRARHDAAAEIDRTLEAYRDAIARSVPPQTRTGGAPAP